MSQSLRFESVELELEYLRQAAERAGEAFACAFDFEGSRREDPPMQDLAPDMLRYVGLFGGAALAWLVI